MKIMRTQVVKATKIFLGMDKERIRTTSTMCMSHFHDFYFLQALEASAQMEIARNPELEFSKPVEKFLTDLDKASERIIPSMALRVFMYLWAACLGEARHAKDTVAENFYITNDVSKNRHGWFSAAVNFRPSDENLSALALVYAQDWRAGYGGEAWGNIVEALSEYATTPNAAWIDHVVDLEHNNGTAFSKPDGEETLKFSVSYPERFAAFLDYKFAKDILTQPPSFIDKLAISPKIGSLLEKYAIVFNKPPVKHVEVSLDNLTDYVVEWGDEVLTVGEKWSRFASVGENGEPNIRSLMDSVGFFNFYPSYYDKNQFAEKVEMCKVRALGKLNDNVSNEFKAKLLKAIAKFKKDGLPKCKLPKAKKTYTVLPCKVVKVKGNTYKLLFDIPYQKGYGKLEDNGLVSVETSLFCDKEKMLDDTYIERRYGEIVLWIKRTYVFLTSSELEALLD